MADGSCILSSQGRARHAPDEEVMQRSGSGYAAVHVGIDGSSVSNACVEGGNRLRRGSWRLRLCRTAQHPGTTADAAVEVLIFHNAGEVVSAATMLLLCTGHLSNVTVPSPKDHLDSTGLV